VTSGFSGQPHARRPLDASIGMVKPGKHSGSSMQSSVSSRILSRCRS
jgi:hypothetical protein